jgi:hypothetical protein
MIAKIKRFISVFVLLAGMLSFVPASPAFAAGCGQGITFFPAWYDGLCSGNGDIKSPASMGGDTGKSFGTWISIIALNVVAMLLYAVGYFSLGFIIFGGFKYMTQGDNSSGTASAKKTIMNAIIGLVISIMSVAIVKFIAGAVVGGA